MPTISHDDVRGAFSRIETKVAADPLYAGGDLEAVRSTLTSLPATVEEFFLETLAEATGATRYAALLLYVELVNHWSARRNSQHSGDLQLEAGTVRCFPGDLHVGGQLHLGAGAQLVVAGEAFVEGGVLAAPRAPSLLAIGGSLRARNIIGAGEVLVARSAIIGDVIYLEGPHSGARVDELRARTVVENSDNRGVFGRIRAQQHFAERLGEVRRDRLRAIGRILGVVGASSVEMIETSLRRAALG